MNEKHEHVGELTIDRAQGTEHCEECDPALANQLKLNNALLRDLTKTLAEYLPHCEESLRRNAHMNDLTPEYLAEMKFKKDDLWEFDLLLGHFIGKFTAKYEGGDRMGDALPALIEQAKVFHAAAPEQPKRVLMDAVLVDFLNFWVSKRCADLGLYARDLKA